MGNRNVLERNSTAIALLILAIVILYVGTRGTLKSDDFDWGNILPPFSEAPPDYSPPPGDGGESGGSMTAAECSAYADSSGHGYDLLASSEGNCAEYAWSTCNNIGLEAAYDYVSGCCIFNCQVIAETPCQTFCSSNGLLLIQTGSWTESQCYDSAIYVCDGLWNLNTDLVSPDGTCCCYLCN